MLQTGFFEYVEPRYFGELAYTPNDPGFANQNALKLIEADKAWDISKGNSTILIGIVDAGMDTSHADLKGKFYEHTSDPINGQDNDNDGYIDNYWGWDFKSSSGNTQFTGGVDHGVQMAGLIAPNTDNGSGLAGVAFNCKMLAVKVTDGSQVVYGFEGIKYAADKGCKVINCSWNIKSYSKFGEDMVNYATQKGALVVAATGNQGKEDQNYPAMYNNVLAVSNTDLNDNRVSNSNIGYYVDLAAPGLNVVTTKAATGFIRNSGTSYSTALTSGAAALIASHNSSLSPEDLMLTLKAGSDPLYQNGKNDFYKNKLGVGRLNVFKAITYNGSFIELDSHVVFDIQGGAIEQADTVELTTWISNYLANSNNVRVVLRDLSKYATVLDSVWNIGTMNKNERKNNASNPFRLRLDALIPQNEVLDFEVELQSNTDTITYGIGAVVNPTYRDITVNKLQTTIGSRGTFGFYEYPQKLGLGVKYNNSAQLLYEGGLIIGQGTAGNSTVVDRIRGVRDVEQTDFRTTKGLVEIEPRTSDMGFYAQFDDANSKAPVGVMVDVSTRAWTDPNHDDYVILDYAISSKNGNQLDNIYVGLFTDWDIDNSEENKADYDGKRYLAYTYAPGSSAPYAGVQLLSEYNDWRCYSIDHVFGGEGGIDITDNDVYSKAEKFTALSNYREKAGENGNGGDVMQQLSTGPHTILKGDTLKVSFAIHGANSLADLQTNADSAFYRQNGALPMGMLETSREKIQLYPNPNRGKVTLSATQNISAKYISVFDITGTEISVQIQPTFKGFSVELIDKKPGVYLIRIGEQVLRWQVVE